MSQTLHYFKYCRERDIFCFRSGEIREGSFRFFPYVNTHEFVSEYSHFRYYDSSFNCVGVTNVCSKADEMRFLFSLWRQFICMFVIFLSPITETREGIGNRFGDVIRLRQRL